MIETKADHPFQRRFPVRATCKTEEVLVVGHGKYTYMWVGNSAECLTVHGEATLREIATAILEQLDK